MSIIDDVKKFGKRLRKKVEKLRKQIEKWWGKFLKKRDAPSSITGVEWDMKNVTLNWVLPTTRDSGGPLPIEEIAGSEISMSADLGNNYSVLNTVPAPKTDLLIPDLETGEYWMQLVCIDIDGRRQTTPTDFTFKVADETNPSSITDVSVTFS